MADGASKLNQHDKNKLTVEEIGLIKKADKAKVSFSMWRARHVSLFTDDATKIDAVVSKVVDMIAKGRLTEAVAWLSRMNEAEIRLFYKRAVNDDRIKRFFDVDSKDVKECKIFNNVLSKYKQIEKEVGKEVQAGVSWEFIDFAKVLIKAFGLKNESDMEDAIFKYEKEFKNNRQEALENLHNFLKDKGQKDEHQEVLLACQYAMDIDKKFSPKEDISKLPSDVKKAALKCRNAQNKQQEKLDKINNEIDVLERKIFDGFAYKNSILEHEKEEYSKEIEKMRAVIGKEIKKHVISQEAANRLYERLKLIENVIQEAPLTDNETINTNYVHHVEVLLDDKYKIFVEVLKKNYVLSKEDEEVLNGHPVEYEKLSKPIKAAYKIAMAYADMSESEIRTSFEESAKSPKLEVIKKPKYDVYVMPEFMGMSLIEDDQSDLPPLKSDKDTGKESRGIRKPTGLPPLKADARKREETERNKLIAAINATKQKNEEDLSELSPKVQNAAYQCQKVAKCAVMSGAYVFFAKPHYKGGRYNG